MATILVVDDEIGIRALLAEILVDAGHRVLGAASAEEAYGIRAREALDLILLDVWMPGEDGLALLRRWANERALVVPTIMLSGYATIDSAVEATRIGASAFLEKPIGLQRLLATVHASLSAHPRPSTVVTPNMPTATQTAVGHTAQALELALDLPLREAREAFERDYFMHHLRAAGGSVSNAAQRVGLERTHLHRRLK